MTGLRNAALRCVLPSVFLFNIVIFTACGTPQLKIKQPVSQSTAPCVGTPQSCSVNVVAQWTGAIVSAPTMSLDGTALPANTLNINGTGTFTTGVGTHTIVVAGSIVINQGVTSLSDTSTFTITPPPTVLKLAPTSGLTLGAGTAGSLSLSTNNPLSAPLPVTVKSSNGNVVKLGVIICGCVLGRGVRSSECSYRSEVVRFPARASGFPFSAPEPRIATST